MPTTTAPAAKPGRPGRAAKRPRPVTRAIPPNPNRVLFRSSIWLFAAFAVAMIVAFWPTYYSRLGQQPTFHPHAHGIAMTLWIVLLVAQAWLIRTDRRAVHRLVGRLSYALVPLMIVTTINFISFRVQGVQNLGAFGLHFLALIFNALVAFLILFGLAIYHRRNAAVHARYMLCTIFPLFTPVTDRLIAAHLPSLIPLVPRIGGSPILPVAGFVLADLMLIGLALWDWRANRRAAVFVTALAVLVLYHVSVMTLHDVPAWQAFGAWFVTLPLS